MTVVRRLLLLPFVAAAGCVLTTDLDGLSVPAAPTHESNDAGADGGTLPASDAATGSGDSSASDAAEAGPVVFFSDDFNRPDGPVGNGWIDAKGGIYGVTKQSLVLTGSSLGYDEAHLYRPATNAPRDLRVSIEVRALSLPLSTPQLHLRATAAPFAAYAAGISGNDGLNYGRGRPAGQFDEFGNVMLDESIRANGTYRLTFEVTGADPVQLTIALERKTDTGWLPIGRGGGTDTSADPIKKPGSFGVSLDGDPNFTYDNFVATPL